MAKEPETRSRGTIKEVKPNKWLVRCYQGMEAGKRKYASKTVLGSKSKAKQELTKLLSEVDTDTFVEPSNLTLNAFMEQWFASKGDLAPRTIRTYKDRWRMDLKDRFGSMKLSQFTKKSIPAFKTHYADLVNGPRGLSRKTVQYSHLVLKQAFEDAIEWDLMGYNPLKRITVPKSVETPRRKQEIAVLTPLQVETLLDWSRINQTIDKWCMWVIMFTTGMRPQEVFALQWPDLSINESTGKAHITVRRAATEVTTGHFELGDTKTYGSVRKISIPPEAVAALKKHRAHQVSQILQAGDRYNRQDLIFANAVGGIWDISKVRHHFKAALKGSKVPKIRLYDTRHTHATGLLLAGVHPKVVSERLGHASITITMNTYSHVIPELSDSTADVVSDTFFAQGRKIAVDAT